MIARLSRQKCKRAVTGFQVVSHVYLGFNSNNISNAWSCSIIHHRMPSSLRAMHARDCGYEPSWIALLTIHSPAV